MIHRRKFTAEFNAQVVLELLSGAKSSAELCREHQIAASVLADWQTVFLRHAPAAFERPEHRNGQEATHVAELERLVGRLTLENDILKNGYEHLAPTVEAQREVVEMLSRQYPVRQLCRVLGSPRSCYDYQPHRCDEASLKAVIERLAGEWPTDGDRRIAALLRREGVQVNHRHVLRLMRAMGLQGQRPARHPRTTGSHHGYPRYRNLVRGLPMVRPDQVWGADITDVRRPEAFVYLAVLMDVYTRRIRGWHLSRHVDQTLTVTA
jgi:transposase-like protein